MECRGKISRKREYADLLERLYYTYKGPMYAYACKFLGKYSNLAEDAVQNAWIRISNHLDIVSTLAEPAVQAYILTCVKHCAIRLVQKEKTVDFFPLSTEIIPSQEKSILDQICDKESLQQVKEAIRELPDIYKDIIRMHYLSNLSLKDIARMYDLSYAAVKKRHTRGIDKLIELIQKKEKLQGGVPSGKKK